MNPIVVDKEVIGLVRVLCAPDELTFTSVSTVSICWFDGPSVPSAAQLLTDGGFAMSGSGVAVRRAVLRPDVMVVVAREVRLDTAILVALRPDEYPDAMITQADFPSDGLQPRDDGERIALTVILDQLHPIIAGSPLLVDSARKVITQLGGLTFLQDCCTRLSAA